MTTATLTPSIADDLLRAYLSERPSNATRGHYRNALNRFARFLGLPCREEAMTALLAMTAEDANAKAQQYRDYLLGTGVTQNTMHSLLEPLRGFTRFAKTQGAIDWSVTFSAQGKPRKLLKELVPDRLSPVSTVAAGTPEGKAEELVWLLGVARNNKNTQRAYRQALTHFAAFMGKPSLPVALAEFLASPRGRANELAIKYLAWMQEKGLSRATMNQRLAALKSYIQVAYETGVTEWLITVRAPKMENCSDTRGPRADRIRSILASLQDRTDPSGVRDYALIYMLYGMALRASEAIGLDLDHLDLKAEKAFIMGKGKTKREPITIPAPVKEAISAWLAVRGIGPGPLLTGIRDGKRLQRESAWRITTKYGLGRPHGLRHAAISRALDLTNGDVRKVRLFSRHKRIETVLVYDDLRVDQNGDVANLVAQDAASPSESENSAAWKSFAE